MQRQLEINQQVSETVQELAEQVGIAQGHAQQNAQAAQLAVEFAKMALSRDHRRPDWTGSFASYGIKKFTAISESDMPFETWGKLVMSI